MITWVKPPNQQRLSVQSHPLKNYLAVGETTFTYIYIYTYAAASEDPLLAQGCETMASLHLQNAAIKNPTHRILGVFHGW